MASVFNIQPISEPYVFYKETHFDKADPLYQRAISQAIARLRAQNRSRLEQIPALNTLMEDAVAAYISAIVQARPTQRDVRYLEENYADCQKRLALITHQFEVRLEDFMAKYEEALKDQHIHVQSLLPGKAMVGKVVQTCLDCTAFLGGARSVPIDATGKLARSVMREMGIVISGRKPIASDNSNISLKWKEARDNGRFSKFG